MKMVIRIKTQALSDGSLVFNVLVIDPSDNVTLDLPACSEKDAVALAHKLGEAILFYTNVDAIQR